MPWNPIDHNRLWADEFCYLSILEFRSTIVMGGLTHTRSPKWYLFCARPSEIGTGSNHLILTSCVDPVGGCSQWWYVIFESHVVPLHGFLNRTPYPGCNPFYTAVALLGNAVACRHIGTPKLQVHFPAHHKLLEFTVGIQSGIICQ